MCQPKNSGSVETVPTEPVTTGLIKTYLYILPEISGAIEMYGWPIFFPCHPYIESTTVLSDMQLSKICKPMQMVQIVAITECASVLMC